MSEAQANRAHGELVRARGAVERLDWEAAFEAYSSAGRDPDLTPWDLIDWATAAYLLGRVDTAIEALTRAHHAFLETGDTPAALRAGFWSILILMNRGDLAQASGWLNRCRQILTAFPAESAEAAYVRLTEAFQLTAVDGRLEEGHRLAMQVAGIARRTRDEDLLALSLNVAGRAAIRGGRSREGLGLLDEAMVAVVSDVLSPPVAGTVYCSVIEACEEISDFARAREWTEALTRWCDRQQGMVTFTGQCLTHRSYILRRKGDWKSAEAEAQRARERFLGAADEVAVAKALYELGEVGRVTGRLREAEEYYRQANEWGHSPQPGLALLRLAQGNVELAAATMRRLVDEAEDPVTRSRLLPSHVDVMLAAGDTDAASEAARELAGLAETFTTVVLQAEADFARGEVALAQGDTKTALRSLHQAKEKWESLDDPYETSRTRALIGVAYRRLGDRDGASLELEAARRTFERLGAATELERLDRLDGDTGGDHSLSPRELEVLRLVAQGRTNQDIADELFLAVKTIDRHVSNILAKLGVASRTAATAYAYEHSLI